jgi:hypothetical protein
VSCTYGRFVDLRIPGFVVELLTALVTATEPDVVLAVAHTGSTPPLLPVPWRLSIPRARSVVKMATVLPKEHALHAQAALVHTRSFACHLVHFL